MADVRNIEGQKIWLDCEFHEDGKTIELISIGLVREDGAAFYAESDWYDWDRMTPWLEANVKPHLRGGAWRISREAMRERLIQFCGAWPEIWGWYGSYDWVALCQIFGTMIDLPRNWPMFIRDAMQYRAADFILPPRGEWTEHHALCDAQWQRQVYYALGLK